MPSTVPVHAARVTRPAGHHVARLLLHRVFASAPVYSLDFPHEFLASSTVRRFSVSGFYDRLDNYHPFRAATT